MSRRRAAPPPPTRSYLICSVQRSGTWLLCHALEDTGVLGVPAEYFHRGDEAFWRERWGVDTSDGAFLDALCREAATPNGVWGSKMMWNYFPDALARLRAWLPSDAPDPDVLDEAFPRMRYIWLRRSDTLRQGISWWRAAATGQFALVDGQRAAKPPAFDRQEIDNLRRLAEASHQGWRDWFAVHAIAPLELVYEDLVEDLDGAVGQVAEFLGVAPPPGHAPPRLHRQADEHTERFVRLYEADNRP